MGLAAFLVNWWGAVKRDGSEEELIEKEALQDLHLVTPLVNI